LIGDDGENLYEFDLRMLNKDSKLNVQSIDLSIANRCTNTEKWQIVELNGNGENMKDAVAIAATNCRMVILKYDGKGGRFKPVRALDTAQSITAILFTQHSAVLSCDKFFEIDLSNFLAEEFLDMSDQSLRPSKKYQPMNVFRINSLEFLLCFKECGIFVDEYGLRSRPDDLQWIHEPHGFFYKNYLLYLIHEDLVQIMRINNTYTKHQENFTTDNNQSRTFVVMGNEKKFTHSVNTPQYCVNVIKTNKVVEGDAEIVSQDLIRLDAEKAFKIHLNRSMNSIISSNSSTSLATLASCASSCDTIN
jgi:citron Rho-interacting kinase